jgi:hypothetical protein
MLRTLLAATALIATFAASCANAQSQSDERLLIVDGNRGRVIYDDGRNDLFCVTRRYVAYYTWSGQPVFNRTMRCR